MKQKVITAFILCLLCLSCNDELEIKQDYDFDVETEKYRSEISQDETVEFVFHLQRSGDYAQTYYFVSCFQREGSGTITDTYGNKLEMNKPYPVYTPETFKLRYTSTCADAQKIELTFSDNFDHRKELKIDLQNKRD